MSFRFFKLKAVMSGALGLGVIAVIASLFHPVRKVSATIVATPPVVEVMPAEQYAQRSLYSAELTLAQARGDEYRSLVQLYKALGGGWQQYRF